MRARQRERKRYRRVRQVGDQRMVMEWGEWGGTRAARLRRRWRLGSRHTHSPYLHVEARRHLLALLPSDYETLAQVDLVGDEDTRERVDSQRFDQPAVPHPARLQRVPTRHVVHEHHGLSALPVRRDHVLKDVLTGSVEDVELDRLVGALDIDGLDRKFDAASHVVRLRKALPTRVEHLDQRRLADSRIANLEGWGGERGGLAAAIVERTACAGHTAAASAPAAALDGRRYGPPTQEA